MTRPVAVVGDLGVDVVVRPSAEPAPGGDTPSSVTHSPGGAGGNSASWLAAYGVPVALLARVGDDLAGAHAREAMGTGVTLRLAVDPDRPTCTVVSVVGAGGERTMLSDRGASGALAPGDLDLEAAAATLGSSGMPHLHLSGFVLLHHSSRAAGRYALEQARRLGWTTSVDPQAANLVAAVSGSAFLQWVRGVDLLLPNEAELAALGGIDAALGACAEVVVTRGAAGAAWYARGTDPTSVPTRTVDVVDTTGCGDAFNAGLLSVWLDSPDTHPERALRRGVEAGSRAATQVGSRPG